MQPISGVPISPVTGVPGWESDDEEAKLSFYAGQVPYDGLIVEIGAEYGRSAAAFLKGSLGHNVRVISVDLWPMYHPVVGDLRAAFTSNLVEAARGISLLNKTIKGDSSTVGSSLPQEVRPDLLFIDGDHTYGGVCKDIKAWSPRVLVGGVMIFHDVATGPNAHPLHYEVKHAIDDEIDLKLWLLEDQVDTLVVYRRLNDD
jgi:predicted O-methyltransferase YrrM